MLNQDYDRFVTMLRELADIPDSEIARAIALFQPRSMKQGEFLVRMGDFPENIAFTCSGFFRLYYADDAGNEYTKGFCMGNRLLTAYSALLLSQPSRLFVQALEDSTVLIAASEGYRSLLNQHLCWQIVHRKIAEELFIITEKREAELLLDDAQTRYLNFLTDYPGLEARLKQHHVASYLGITPETLSRIRTRLKSH